MPKLPLDQIIEAIVAWLGTNVKFLFDFISGMITGIVNAFALIFHSLPIVVVILLFTALAYWLGRWGLAAFAAIGLLLIWNLGFWDPTMDTLALVLTAALVSIIFGLPLGIWCTRNRTVDRVLTPILDFMQTMPAFVYLIPAVTFFGLGVVPGVIASVIFSIPPTIRLTKLGIHQVPAELVEAADAFGSTSSQKLYKVQLPLALSTIMAGINQTIMLSLSMVVIASMIGAQGVGADVYRSVTQLKIGKGFEAGLAVVILAILLDRITQRFVGNPKRGRSALMGKAPWILGALVVFCLGAGLYQVLGTGAKKGDTVGSQVNYTIVGIDPGAGLMKATNKAIQDYQLNDWNLLEGSGTAMTAALDKAYKANQPIIVTGWTPHWMFTKYDLKYLDDPKNSFGGSEEIHTMTRLGLKSDQPSAYQFLDKFNWTPTDMEQVMAGIQEGKKPEEAAAAWVNDNPDKVNAWIEGVPKAPAGQKLKLAYVAWDSEIASTNVVRAVLTSKLGYQVDMLQVEIGPMWAGIAGGDVDAMVAAWLPTTSKDFYDKYKGKFDDLGANLSGTKLGLVVPKYMNINSIEDLKK
ncbi:glycine betaine ABC transporter substrate-binding protein [Paenibacillus aurantius]|uniref:Glycine betaine ABC transporter substrate-binding protein n=1 Tax=Paenibacillus aurantius TaxID=2918900 RepID=A0AA96RH10_9BACL|nr:glycine betaine ABC transporter substrate-binding protein [Paenibacillus aurantius]WNQ13046.1 glycine betaine ABC transporter substrate-binding protein [Paenibacillus aurantius]